MLTKKIWCVLVAVFCFLATGAQDQQVVEKQIRQLEQDVVQAILRSDTNLLKQLWAPEFLVNTPRNDIAHGRTAVFDIQKTGIINYSAFERTIDQVLIRGDLAITMGSEWYMPSANLAATAVPVRRRFTNVWTREGGLWRQIARHASVICPGQ